jgi:hypothetical protein
MNPYDTQAKVFKAALAGEPTQALEAAAMPLVGAEFTPIAVYNAIKGVDDFGKPLYPSNADKGEMAYESITYLVEKLGPTFVVKNLKNILAASATGINTGLESIGLGEYGIEGGTKGKSYNIADEIYSFVGAKASTRDMGKSLGSVAWVNDNDAKLAIKGVKDMVQTGTYLPKAKIVAAVDSALKTESKATQKIVDATQFLLNAGMDERIIAARLDKTLTKGELNDIMDGHAPDYQWPTRTLKDLYDGIDVLNPTDRTVARNRVNIIQDATDAYNARKQ